MTQDLMSSLADEISYGFNRMKEEAIHRAIMRAEGCIPEPQALVAYGMFVRVSTGEESYEEFRWKSRSMFQIRLSFEKMKAVIEVKDL